MHDQPDLGYSAAGGDIFLTFTAADRDARVGIALQETAGPDITAGNSIVVTFLGQPSSASVPNPVIGGGTPLIFSGAAGLWSVQIDIENELDPAGPIVFNANNALPVAQVGDSLPTSGGSITVDSLLVYDPIDNVATDDLGAVRTQRRGDHQIAFRAGSGANAVVIRARSYDSDEDGLFDHWERAGGGIDVDQDGSIDLDLNTLGANPLIRDIFIEMDWTQPRVDPPRSYSNQPAEGATAMVASVFAGAPALANGIPLGVVAHIDAGTGTDTLGAPFSQNFPLAFAQGGQLIGQVASPTTHLDVVYPGTPGSLSVPGGNARAFEDIKNNFFGSADSFAREFAFHYVVLADSYAAYEDFATDTNGDGVANLGDTGGPDGLLCRDERLVSDAQGRSATPTQPIVVSSTSMAVTVSGTTFPTVGPGLVGDGVLVTSGAGAGQLRGISSTSGATLTVSTPWSTNPGPGDTITVVSGSSGLGETSFRPAPNYHGVPGNDTLVTFGPWPVTTGILGSSFYHWRTIVHELGHTLGLRHCGTNPNASLCIAAPTNYESLMSYAHQNKSGTGVNSYSPRLLGVPDPTFDDWFHLRPDSSRGTIHVGNTLFAGLGALQPGQIIQLDDLPDPEQNYRDAVIANGGPIDFDAPLVNVTSPLDFTSFLQGQNMTVTLDATDNVALAAVPVVVTFDVDGSGAIDVTGETLVGTPTGNPDEYEVAFMNIGGPDGLRKIDARATDTMMSTGQDIVPIVVPEPGAVPTMVLGAVLLGLLHGRRTHRNGQPH